MTDPYDILGVGRDATDEDLRAAYRKGAKRDHPDAGGAPGAFEKLTQALALLTDVKRRAHYDRTGDWGSDKPDNPLSGPIGVLMAFFNDVVAQFVAGQGMDPTKVDLLAAAARHVGTKLDKLRQTKAMAERHIAMIEKMAERTSAKNGDSVLKKSLLWSAGKMREEIAPVLEDITFHEQALDLLANHTFRFDQAPTSPWPSATGLGQAGGFFTMGTGRAGY